MMLVGEIAQHFPDVGRKMLEENVLGEILKLKAPEEDKLWKTRDEKIDLLIHSLMNEEKLLKEKMKTLIIKFLQYQHEDMQKQANQIKKEAKKTKEKEPSQLGIEEEKSTKPLSQGAKSKVVTFTENLSEIPLSDFLLQLNFIFKRNQQFFFDIVKEICVITEKTHYDVEGKISKKNQFITLKDEILKLALNEKEKSFDKAQCAEIYQASLNNKIISKLPKASKNPLSPIDKLYEYIKDEPLGIVVRHLLNAIVDKYVDNYKGIEDYFIEESKVISSKTDQGIESINYKTPTENTLFSFENMINPLINIFNTYPATISILYKFQSDKVNKKYQLIDFIINKIACLGYLSYQNEKD